MDRFGTGICLRQGKFGSGYVWDRIDLRQGKSRTWKIPDWKCLGQAKFGASLVWDRIGSGQGVGLDYQ